MTVVLQFHEALSGEARGLAVVAWGKGSGQHAPCDRGVTKVSEATGASSQKIWEHLP
jgi:hypothetical protein